MSYVLKTHFDYFDSQVNNLWKGNNFFIDVK